MSSAGGVISGGTTRRGFLAGAGIGVAAQVAPLGLGAIASADKPCTPSARPQRTVALAAMPDRSGAWLADSTQRTITAHDARTLAPGMAIEVGGAPVALAIGPAGRRALVVTAHYDHPALAFVDLKSGRLADRIDVGREPTGVAIAPDGRSAVVVGGGADGTLTRIDTRSGRVHAPVAVGRHPRGVTLSPDGSHAYVAVNGDAVVAVVALTKGTVVQRFGVAPYPSQLAIAPDGHRLLVTHDGFGAQHVTPIDLVQRRPGKPVRVGLDPSGVAFGRTGRFAAVAATGHGRIAILDVAARRVRRVLEPGGFPRVVAGAGNRIFVADWKSGALTRLELKR